MCHDNRVPHTATRTNSAQRRHRAGSPSASPRMALTSATAASARPQVTSTTEIRPALRAAYAVTSIAIRHTAAEAALTTRKSVMRHAPPECSSSLSAEGQLLHVEVLRGEAGAGVLQVEVPEAQEGLVESETEHLVVRGAERPVPPSQRLGVVAAERELVGQPQRRVLPGQLVDRLHRRQEAAGEDVLVDPRPGVARG